MKYSTRGGRASICSWDLCFRFLIKEQATKAIEKLLAWECPVNFSYEEEMGTGIPVYTIQLDNMSWAGNLEQVAKFLQEVDWSDETIEEEDEPLVAREYHGTWGEAPVIYTPYLPLDETVPDVTPP